MSITFDTENKIIQLDTYTVDAAEIWSAFVDWSIIGDNLKHGVILTQIGGYEPIALYIYLELGWRIRPIEADGVTTITGNILVEGGDSPIAETLGDWQVLVNMETPVKATTISVDSGSGLTSSESSALLAIHDYLEIINSGIKKASLMIPHNEDLS